MVAQQEFYVKHNNRKKMLKDKLAGCPICIQVFVFLFDFPLISILMLLLLILS